MKIEVTKTKIFRDGELWGNRKKYDIGQQLLNVLFYSNKEGRHEYSIIIEGKDETEEFKAEVKKRYKDIPNTELRDSFFKFCKI